VLIDLGCGEWVGCHAALSRGCWGGECRVAGGWGWGIVVRVRRMCSSVFWPGCITGGRLTLGPELLAGFRVSVGFCGWGGYGGRRVPMGELLREGMCRAAEGASIVVGVCCADA